MNMDKKYSDIISAVVSGRRFESELFHNFTFIPMFQIEDTAVVNLNQP